MSEWASRVGRFAWGSHPPLASGVVAVFWACGVTGLFAALDSSGAGWRPGGGTAVAAVTVFVDLLLMRALAAAAPLAVPALAARSFVRGRARWPRPAIAGHLLATFASYLALGLAR